MSKHSLFKILNQALLSPSVIRVQKVLIYRNYCNRDSGGDSLLVGCMWFFLYSIVTQWVWLLTI